MWAQNSLWDCMGILVSGLMRLGPENLYLNNCDVEKTHQKYHQQSLLLPDLHSTNQTPSLPQH